FTGGHQSAADALNSRRLGLRIYLSNSPFISSLLLISRPPRASVSFSHLRFFHALMRRSNECAYLRCWHLADMTTAFGDVRFGGKADIQEVRRQCPLATLSDRAA